MVEQPLRGTRPRNRRDLIITAASELFVTKGYASVSMADIASAVAIGPSALYRHFPSKEDLLFESVQKPFAALMSSLEASEAATVTQRIHLMIEQALANRDLGTLWQRESRHLAPESRDRLRAQLLAVQRVMVTTLASQRPELSAAEADLLIWGAMDALMSVSFQGIQLPHDEYVALLMSIIGDVVGTQLPSRIQDPTTRQRTPDDESGRSTADRLVAAATRLFAERGYHSVGIDEVAAVAGIAGPSIYHHFHGKADLLMAAIGDAADHLVADQARILAEPLPPRAMLDRLIESFVDFAFTNTHVLDVMVGETLNFDAPSRQRAREQQRAYIQEWVRLLEVVHPDLPQGHARVRVQAALTLVNDIARTGHLRRQAGTRAAVAAIAAAILR